MKALIAFENTADSRLCVRLLRCTLISFFLFSLAMLSAWSAEYTLAVAAGETSNLKDKFLATYPGQSLQSGDTIIKLGAGHMIDYSAEEVTAQRLPLNVEIREGSYSRAIGRLGGTYSVSNGAALVVGLAMNSYSNAEYPLTIYLAGSGTTDYPGALYCSGSAGADNQYVTYHLSDDAVIYHASSTSVINFSSEKADPYRSVYNAFVMNGHSLTFRSSGPNRVVRFRFLATFINPGPVIFDNIGFSRTGPTSFDWGVRACRNLDDFNASQRVLMKLPILKIVNGAVVNLMSNGMTDNIDLIDAEHGTTIGKPANASDSPKSTFSIGKLTGSPAIAGSAVTVNRYIAKKSDLEAGAKLTSSLALTLDRVDVESVTNFEKNVSYTLAESSDSIAGDCSNPHSLWSTLTKGEKSVTWAHTGDRTDSPDDYLLLIIPSGSTMSFAQATAGYATDELTAAEGKSLLVCGGGTYAPNSGAAYGGRWGALRLAEGVAVFSEYKDFPIRDSSTFLAVEDGAKARISTTLSSLLIYGKCSSRFELSGDGGDGNGALQFDSDTSSLRQESSFVLKGDTVIGLSKTGMLCFSNNESASDTASPCLSKARNRFEMNGHKLTFRRATDSATASTCYVRFRYATTFVNPGEIVFDGIGFTKLSTYEAPVYVLAADGETAATLPKVSFVNGARFNPSDMRLTDVAALMDFASGTTIGKVGSDSAQSVLFANTVTGAPTIDGCAPVFSSYVAKADDLMQGHKLTSEQGVTLTTLAIDDRSLLTADTPYEVMSVGDDVEIASFPRNMDGWFVELATDEYNRTMTATRRDRGNEDRYFVLDVPNDKSVYTWNELKGKFTEEELAQIEGRQFVKSGAGCFKPNAKLTQIASASALVVAEGIYFASEKADFPFRAKTGDEIDNVLSATILPDATMWFGVPLEYLSDNGNRLCLTVGGSGADNLMGALHFASEMGTSPQNVVFTLTDDAVFTFAGQEDSTCIYNFSNLESSRQDERTQNRFECNNHRLTFKSAMESPVTGGIAVRFRYSSTFVDPTTVAFDGVALTTTASNGIFNVVASNDKDMKLPLMKFSNNARLNVQNGKIVSHVKAFDFSYYSSIGKVGGDAAGSGTLSEVIGCPAITDEQTVTIGTSYTARMSDATDGGGQKIMNAATGLKFAAGCRAQVIVDEEQDPEWEVNVAQCPAGMMTGVPLGCGCRVRVVTEGDYDYLKLAWAPAMILLLK